MSFPSPPLLLLASKRERLSAHTCFNTTCVFPKHQTGDQAKGEAETEGTKARNGGRRLESTARLSDRTGDHYLRAAADTHDMR